MRARPVLLPLGVLNLFLAGATALADQPCEADVEKFCSHVRGGRDRARRILSCLHEHADELSPDCRERGKEIGLRLQETVQAIAEPCQDDYRKFCSHVGAGPGWGGRVRQCLQEHEPELTADCRAQQSRVEETLEAATEACQPDVERFCSHVGEGPDRARRVLACLRSHEPELSEPCRAQREGVREEVEGFGRACREDSARLCRGKLYLRQCLEEHEAELSQACRAAVSGR